MIIKNLDSGIDWTGKVSLAHDAFPNELSIGAKKFPVIKPVAILLANIATMNEIQSLTQMHHPHSYFLAYGDLNQLSGKSNMQINTILGSQGTADANLGQPGLSTWGHHWLIEYLKANFGIKVNPREPLIFLCPEAIKQRFVYVEDYIKRVMRVNRHIGHARDHILQCVTWHEMTHICFERVDMRAEARLSEGLANAITYLLADDLGKEVLNIMACSSEMDFRRNYYHILRYYGSALDSIIDSYLSGHRGDAFATFEHLRLQAEQFSAVETDGGALRIGGPISGDPWLAYGAKNKPMSVAPALPYLCNIKSGYVIAPRIGSIVGYLNESTKVVTHEIGHHEYPKMPINIRLLGKDEADIEQVVRGEILKGKITEAEFAGQFFT